MNFLLIPNFKTIIEGRKRRNELTIWPKNEHWFQRFKFILTYAINLDKIFDLDFNSYQINHRFFEWLTNHKIQTFISSNTLIDN